MGAVPKLKTRYYTPEEYFEIDARSEQRLEYLYGVIMTMDGEVYHEGEIVAMAGESLGHNEIALNVAVGMRIQFRGRPCHVYIKGVRVHVSEGQYRYPDVVALCGEPQTNGSNPPTVLNPVVIFEVLSPSTQSKDTGIKQEEFTRLPTVTDYALVAQDRMSVRHHHRISETTWEMRTYNRTGDIISLEALDVALTVADIYENITLPEPSPL